MTKIQLVFFGDKVKYKDADIENWPKIWASVPEDINYGKELIQLFKPFIKYLKESQLTTRTIIDHIDNLWVLGGHIIKQCNYYPEQRDKDSLLLLPRYIDSWDGPNIYDLSEYEQKSFDRTCRKYYKYLVENDLRNLLESDNDFFD